MGRGTGLYADQARRQRREELHYLTAAKRLPDDHLLRCIDAMDLDTFLAISNPIVVICMWTEGATDKAKEPI